MHLHLRSLILLQGEISCDKKILKRKVFPHSYRLEVDMTIPEQFPPSSCICLVRHWFVTSVLATGHSRIYVRKRKRNVLVPWGFMHLMFHASNVFSEVSSL